MEFSEKVWGVTTGAILLAAGGSQFWSVAEGWAACAWEAEWKGVLISAAAALLTGVAVGIWIVRLTDVRRLEDQLKIEAANSKAYQEGLDAKSEELLRVRKELEEARSGGNGNGSQAPVISLHLGASGDVTASKPRIDKYAEARAAEQEDSDVRFLERLEGPAARAVRGAYEDGEWRTGQYDPTAVELFKRGIITSYSQPNMDGTMSWRLSPKWREVIDGHPGILDGN